MSMEDELVEWLKDNKEIEKIILFGSRNTETFREDSDYDICIVMDNQFDKSSLVKKLYEFMKCFHVLIHPFIYSNDEYSQKMEMDVYRKNIKDTGTEIYSRNNSI